MRSISSGMEPSFMAMTQSTDSEVVQFILPHGEIDKYDFCHVSGL
jgi:hypothetical protein